MKKPVEISAEKLGHWYLRLNGYLTIPNFIVHPDLGLGQRTYADILGVRFPHRAELSEDPMADDPTVVLSARKTCVVITEIKKGQCALNGPWTRREDGNMEHVISAVGVAPKETISDVADSLYTPGQGFWEDDRYYVSLLCLGASRNGAVSRKYPRVPQVLWTNILHFIYMRYRKYPQQKSHHDQWPRIGKLLWDTRLGMATPRTS